MGAFDGRFHGLGGFNSGTRAFALFFWAKNILSGIMA